MTAADRLAEIEARIEAATEGPWEANSCDVETVPPFDLHRFDAMGLTVARCVQDVTDAAYTRALAAHNAAVNAYVDALTLPEGGAA